MKYQFQVRAANMAGVGIPSLPSDTFLCEEWTIAVPGVFSRAAWFHEPHLWSSPIAILLFCHLLRASVRPADPGGAQRLTGAAVEGSRISGSRPRQRLLRGHEGGRGSARGLEGSQQQGHGEDLHEGSSSLILPLFFSVAQEAAAAGCAGSLT